MKIKKYIVMLSLVALMPFLIGVAANQDTKEATTPAKQTGEKKQTNTTAKGGQIATAIINIDKLVYKPPLRGAPAGRVGGGTRGATERESFSLQVLVPDHAALTISDQPNLYWYISKHTTYPVELTVIEKNAVKPLIETTIRVTDKGGIQVIRLADYGIHLRENVQYKWFVALLMDAEQRSKDILAGGIITLVDASPSLKAKLAAADRNDALSIYAEEGLWYDALSAISGMIDASPDNRELRRARASLLEQIGLTEVAIFENR